MIQYFILFPIILRFYPSRMKTKFQIIAKFMIYLLSFLLDDKTFTLVLNDFISHNFTLTIWYFGQWVLKNRIFFDILHIHILIEHLQLFFWVLLLPYLIMYHIIIFLIFMDLIIWLILLIFKVMTKYLFELYRLFILFRLLINYLLSLSTFYIYLGIFLDFNLFDFNFIIFIILLKICIIVILIHSIDW